MQATNQHIPHPLDHIPKFPSFVALQKSVVSQTWPGNQPVIYDTDFGVIKISGLPHTILQNEIIIYLSLGLPVRDIGIHSGIHAIHVIVNPITGKTQDCYVEVRDVAAAQNFVASSSERTCGGYLVTATLGSVEEMMMALYPRANCDWVGGMPRVRAIEGDNEAKFEGFVTMEELKGLRDLVVEMKTESNQNLFDCPERIYQAAMSILARIPFTATPGRHFLASQDYLLYLYDTMNILATHLATEIRRKDSSRAGIKILIHLMIILRRSPLLDRVEYGQDKYMGLCRRVDAILQALDACYA